MHIAVNAELMRKQFIKYSVALPLILLCLALSAQINTGSPDIPFGSNTSYEYGIMPTNLPTSGTYGASNDAANQYTYWKNQFVASCSGGQYRVKFDNPSETVSEGIAYGLLLAAYAADKDLFDGLWAYYKANSNGNGVMNWKINGCSGASGQNGAADAEIDAAMALIVAEHQWPSATSPYDYGAEANTLISAIESTEIHPSSYQLINGDAWGFGNNCRNPSYQAPAYYKVYAQHTGNNSWTSNMVPAAYTLINNNVNGSTGLVSNWSDPNGSANSCNGPNEYGYDACRSPWRMATDVIWFDDADGKAICNDLASYTSGVGASNVGGPRPQSGGNGGTHNTTFVSTYAAGIMGANSSYQSHMNAMYSETVSVSDNAYFGETLKTIMLFMMTGNFWNPYAAGGSGNPVCSVPDLGATQSICGQSSINLSSGLSTDGIKTFRWYKDNSPQGGASTNANTFTVTSAGEYKVVVDSIGECSSEATVVISGTLASPDLGSDVQICASPTVILDANVSGGAINYSWKKDNSTISGENSQTLEVSETGTYEVTVSAASCGSASDQVVVTSALPLGVGDTICSAGEVTLTASGGSSPYNWFVSEGATSAVGTGSTFQPTISSSTTYWLEANGSGGGSVTVGPSNSGSGPWNISDYSTEDKQLFIDPLTDVTLTSVSVEATGNTNVTINVYNDGSNQLVETKSVTVGSGMQAISLNAALSSGTRYRIDAVGTNTGLEFKNQGNPSYPITESGVVTLTNTTSWNANWSLFFNLEFSTGQSCSRIPVEAVIDPGNNSCVTVCTEPSDVTINQGASATLCPSDNINLTTNNQPNSSDFDFTWYQGNYPGGSIVDGPSSNVNHLDYTVQYGNASDYTIVVRDKNNPSDASCIKTATITITDLSAPNATITTSGNDLEYCQGQNGVTLTAADAGAGASYSWSGPASGSGISLSNATEGVYSVSVTKDGCISTSANVNVIENTAPNAVILTSGNALLYCEGTGGVTLSAESVGGANYMWTGPVNGAGNSLSNATNGAYTLSVTLDGCSASDNVTVQEIANPVAVIETNGLELEYCAGGSGVNLTAENAGSGATYEWSGPVTGSGIELTNATAGAYTIEVSKAGCVSTSTAVNVTESAGINVSITNTANDLEYCQGDGGVTLTASNVAGGTYSWFKDGSAVATGNPLVEASQGDYYVQVSSGSCSATSSTVTVVEKPVPTATILTTGNALQYCEGETGVNLEAENVNGATYAWSGPVTGTSSVLNDATEGNYSVAVTVDGCTASSTQITVIENTLPEALITTSGDDLSYCSGGSGVTLTASDAGNGATYEWFEGAQSVGMGNPISNVLVGDYSVTVERYGCTNTSSLVAVVEGGDISAAFTASSPDYCEGEDGVTLTAEGAGTGASYSWLSNGQNVASGQVFANALAGTYTLEVSSGSCSATSNSLTVNEIAAPIAEISTTDLNYCEGDNGITLSAITTAGASYSWSGSTSNSASISNALAGDYSVTVTVDECSSTSSMVTVIENELPLAEIGATELSYCENENGVLLTAVDAGSGAQYSWAKNNQSAGAGTELSNALAGSYELTVTRNGCEATSPTTIVYENSTPNAQITTNGLGLVYCEGTAGANLQAATVVGATYEWFRGNTTVGTSQSLNTATSGTYTVVVTKDGCSATSTGKTTQEVPLPGDAGNITGTIQACEGVVETYSLQAVANATSYNWEVSAGSTIITNSGTTVEVELAGGGGQLEVTPTNSCGVGGKSTISINVTGAVNPEVSIAAQQNPVCEGGVAVLNANASNGGASPTYQWFENNVEVGSNSSSYVVTDVSNNDEIRVEMISNSTCADGVMVSSQLFELKTVEAPIITSVNGPDTICNTKSPIVEYEVTNNAGSSYNWNVPQGATVVGQGTSNISVDFTNVTGNEDLVSVSELSDDGCASDVAFKFVTLSCLVAVNHTLDASLVSVYPNPFTDKIEIELDLFSNSEVHLEVLNANGLLVNQQHISAQGQISLGDNLEPGVYWLKFIQEDQFLVKKVVKLD